MLGGLSYVISKFTKDKDAENAVPFPAGIDFTRWYGIVTDNAARIFAQEVTPKAGTDAIYAGMQAVLDK